MYKINADATDEYALIIDLDVTGWAMLGSLDSPEKLTDDNLEELVTLITDWFQDKLTAQKGSSVLFDQLVVMRTKSTVVIQVPAP